MKPARTSRVRLLALLLACAGLGPLWAFWPAPESLFYHAPSGLFLRVERPRPTSARPGTPDQAAPAPPPGNALVWFAPAYGKALAFPLTIEAQVRNEYVGIVSAAGIVPLPAGAERAVTALATLRKRQEADARRKAALDAARKTPATNPAPVASPAPGPTPAKPAAIPAATVSKPAPPPDIPPEFNGFRAGARLRLVFEESLLRVLVFEDGELVRELELERL